MSDSPVRVLLVEDDPGDARLVQKILDQQSNGRFDLACADTLSQATERLTSGDIDVALLDLSLPDSRGFDTFLQIYEQFPEVPILVLTNLDDEELSLRCIQAGAQDYLTKGQIEGELLMRIIRHSVERKKIEKALRESEERYRTLVENISLGISLIDPDHKIIMTNASFGRLFNKPVSEFVGKHCFREFEKREAICSHCPGTIAMATRRPASVETEGVRDDGSRFSVFIQAFPILGPDGAVKGFIGIVEDITKHKKMETALCESEETFRNITASAQDAILMMDNDGNISYWNEAAERIFGYTKEEAIGKEMHTFLGPERYHEAYRKGFSKFKETGQGHAVGKTLELSAIRRDGREFPISLSVSSVKIRDKWNAIGILRDISKRKEAEKKLRESQEKYRTLVDNINIGVALISPDMEILSLNKQMEKWFPDIDVSKKPVCYRSFFGDPERKDQCRYCPVSKTFEDGQSHETTVDQVSEMRMKSHRIAASPIHDKEGKVIAAIEMIEDITEKKAMEQSLMQSSRLAGIGELAAGVAHEINNPIGFVASNTNTLHKYFKRISNVLQEYRELRNHKDTMSMDDMVKKLGGIETLENELKIEKALENSGQIIGENIDGLNRVKKIVQNLKTFSHISDEKTEGVNLNQLLDDALNLVRNAIKYKAEVVKNYGDIRPIGCFSSQLAQVFTNILVNAAQAIEKHGIITVRTYEENGNAVINIMDTGCGMTKETMDRIFNPFFTTKEAGKGTGLGLSISHQIIERHKGDIRVESQPGKGTSFEICLPLN